MRKTVFEAWRTITEDLVASEFKNFSKVTVRSRGEPRQLLKYVWRPQENLWCYIAFRPLDSEAFDALIGWSCIQKFPISDAGAGSGKQDIWDFTRPSVIVWSSQLVPRSGLAHWNFWEIPESLLESPEEFGRVHAEHFLKQLSDEDARQLVRPAIAAGVAEVKKYGIPYLEQRALHHASG